MAEFVAGEPGASVVRRDLGHNHLPHIGESYLGALFSPAETWNDKQRELVALSDALIAEVQAADIVIIASAMINFSIPSTLKTWLDYIVRAGKTFSYATGSPVGLVTGKRVVLVEAKGGVYSEGPMKAFDYQQPYLRFMLGFMGMTDVEVIHVEGVNSGADAAKKAIEAAGVRATQTAKNLVQDRAAA